MYSYNTLYYICQFCQSFFYNRKNFQKNIDKRNFLRYTKKRKKIPRARGGLTARPHSCVSEHAFKLNQGGKEYIAHGRIAGTFRGGST